MAQKFHYRSGESVCVGDRVRINRRSVCDGYVAEVEITGTAQALACNCPAGYVCTVANENGENQSFLWTPPDGEHWEDLEFVSRARGSE